MSGMLFSTPMVLALLEGRKTQTRRIIHPSKDSLAAGDIMVTWPADAFVRQSENFRPKIKTGDRLWVREAWRADSQLENISPLQMSRGEPVFYEADQRVRSYGCAMLRAGRKRSSIHMPRWASRITLEVTDVRIERLQSISKADAMAEGIEQSCPEVDPSLWKDYGSELDFDDPVLSYASLWDSINGSGSWDANPWVVAYTFRVHLMNIDQLEGRQ